MDECIETPHVLIFPFPAQGHVTPMLNLAELLCLSLANLKVTFLNTTHNHKCLTKHTDIEARFGRYPGFKFKAISDGHPEDHPRLGDQWLSEMARALPSSAEPYLRDILVGADQGVDKFTCFILDGWMKFASDLASEAKVPVIAVRFGTACFIWSSYCILKLIQSGDIPFKDEVLDELVKSEPGMDSFFRYRDLPSYCRNLDTSSCRNVQYITKFEIQGIEQAHSVILNTFEDLEGPTLSLIRSHCSRVYPIGPLHTHLRYRLSPTETAFSSNLCEVDPSCISWLDSKPEKSVVYVSFGSSTMLTKEQLMELRAGLVQSNKYFLWVLTSNLVKEINLDSPNQDDFLEGIKERGYIVSWAPQEEVLVHQAIGGFLTHSGWNSTLESIVAGVPMLCWPYFADQHVNSRFVSQVWKIGLDMKDTCDRTVVENMINDLMERKKDELQGSMSKMSKLAKKSISEGGFSHSNLKLLIEDIKGMVKKEGQ